MARETKEMMVAELEGKFRDLKDTGCVLINYQGLKASQTMAVRQAIRQGGAEMMVVKNSLFALALQRLGAEGLTQFIDGPLAVVRADSPARAAKATVDVASTFKVIQVRGGYAEGKVVGPAVVQKLATIPSREVLLGMLAGALMGPLRRLAGGLLAKPRALLSGLQQLREQAEQRAG